MPIKMRSLTKKKFTRLFVLNTFMREDRAGYRRRWCYCQCDCGKKVTILAQSLISGHSKACGCLNKLHGFSGTRFYSIWKGLIYRSKYLHPEKKFDKKWLKFENFHQDMFTAYNRHAARFGMKDTTIDRIDNRRGYSKQNCRWATMHIQRMNQDRMKL